MIAKSKLNSIEALTSKILIDSNISHDEFFSINNALKEFYDIKEEFQNSNNKEKIVGVVEKILKVKMQK